MTTTRRCKFFSCPSMKGRICCHGCDRASRCRNACKNSPEKCGGAEEKTRKGTRG